MAKKKQKEKESSLRVTDHAILRYLERAKNINVEEVRGYLQNQPKVEEQVKILGEGYFPLKDCKVYIQDNTIITVIVN